ncbi:MAG: PAS domain S-box protein, partial [Saprospiraceae bacterium]|nr:PAS domain S-box protein [Saprospiraceae bacterium]
MEKIPFKLLAVFLLLAAGISAGGFVFYKQQRARSVAHIQDDLNTIAQLKSEEITAWRRERYGDAYVLSKSEILVTIIQQWLARPSDEKIRRQIHSRLEAFKVFDNYEAVYLIDANGQVKISVTGERIHQLGAPTLASIALAAKSKSIIFSDFYYCPLCQHEHLDIFVPLNNGPEYVGCIIFRVNPHVFLYPLIQTWPTSSKSGETILLLRDGDDVLYLNELRHQKDTAVKLRLPMSDTLLPAVMAAMGKEGMVEGHDYRDAPVAAYIRPIPDSPWFMVAKVDKDEIYAPLKRQAWNIAILVSLLLVLLAAALGFLWQGERRGFYKKQYELELDKQALIRHYDYLTMYANDIILLSDEKYNLIEVNDRACQVYGYSREELLKMKASDL